jgi:protein-disulfide isomerase
MRRYLLLIVVVALTALVYAQSKSARPTPRQRARVSASETKPGLPSKATTESFLRHVLGWENDVSWTITSIAPSAAPGIAEITIDLKAPQKSGTQKLFVLPDRKHVIYGQMYPFTAEPGAPKPSDTAINDFVRQMTKGNPAVTWTIAENKPDEVSGLTRVLVVLTTAQGRGPAQFYVTPDGTHALVGELSPFGADPYAAARAELARGINGPARGSANAPVTIVEFADLQCPACKAAMPTVEHLLAEVPNARFVFQQFPLVQIHKWAFKAATFGDCVARESNPAFWKFVQNVYANQEQINETNAEQKLTEAAVQAGVDGPKTAVCAALPATVERINHSMDLGKAMGVTGTPTLFVGGRQISNVGALPPDALKKMTEFMARTAAKQTAAKGK